jgi:hypothetical protein
VSGANDMKQSILEDKDNTSILGFKLLFILLPPFTLIVTIDFFSHLYLLSSSPALLYNCLHILWYYFYTTTMGILTLPGSNPFNNDYYKISLKDRTMSPKKIISYL